MKELDRMFRGYSFWGHYIHQQSQSLGQRFITFFQLQHPDISFFGEANPSPGIIKKINACFISKEEVILTFCQKHAANINNEIEHNLSLLKYDSLFTGLLYYPEHFLQKMDFYGSDLL